ncbi:sulfite exporter TauE/SafE family protein [Specibacter cremeus]|uniref:sulfite exporter TauE/SafE family protein n=1 Tax=Specibacter cremeus TaxID=1629051 RepID=UPI000F76C28C|nr:sulfite exporter TauE/SafE family protein [Specibacter cremeus]
MTTELFILTAVAVAIASLVQGSTGMGFALIVAPIVGIYAPSLLPVMLLILMLPLNAYVVWRERHALDLHGAGWITAGRIAGTVVGFWVLIAVPASGLSILIGVSTIAAALASLLVPAFTAGRTALIAVGAVTGVTETATGIGGPPLVLAYQHRPAPVLRSTVAFCFLVGEILSLVLLGVTGKVTGEQVSMAVFLLPALAVGALVSAAIHHRLSGRRMRTIVLSFALVSGIAVLVHG